MVKHDEHSNELTACNSTGNKDLNLWTLAWLVTLAIATFGPIYLWQHKALSIVFIVVNFLVGIGMIFANKRHFQKLDELQRKILLDSTAITCGVGVVAGLSYSLLDVTNLVSFDAEIPHLVLLMGLTYSISTKISSRQYS